jgi:antitoxin (DNA-binding transcriptional repressor) of toxin-antitoxin stability system
MKTMKWEQAIIQDMSTVRITETELARDVHAVLEKVRQGVEVIVEQDHRPFAVIKASQSADRKISEVIAALEASGANAVLDEDFARDVEEGVQTYRESWNPPSVD